MMIRQAWKKISWMGLAALFAGTATVQSATYYVDVVYDLSQGESTGATNRPFTNLTAAVVAANTNAGNVVIVADGVYASTNALGYENFGTIGIVVTNSMTVKGGYIGQVSEGAFDWTDGSRTTRTSVIDLSGTTARAFYQNVVGKTMTVDGFTFRNANVSGDGGAVYIQAGFNGWSSLYNCLFSNNVASGNGGAVYLGAGNNVTGGALTNCTFVGNRAGAGGGLYNKHYNPSITASDCVFKDNIATNTGGGGLATDGMVVRRCTFQGNQATKSTGSGGAMAVVANSGFISAYQCVFQANKAGATGAGLGSVMAGGTFNPGTFYAENCLMTGNTGTYTVIESGSAAAANITLKHCTLADNEGSGVRADLSTGNGDVVIQNCIVANNGLIGVTTDDTTPTINFNDVYGQTTNYAGTAVAGLNDLSGDPLFADASAGNYRLTKVSPGIDSGTNLTIGVDLVGGYRPARLAYDIGAYEESELPGLVIGQPARESSSAWLLGRLDSPGQPDTAYFMGWRAGGDGGTDKSQWTWVTADRTGRVVFAQAAGLSPETAYTYRILASNSYDEMMTSPWAFVTPTNGASPERVWTAALATDDAGSPGNWIPVGMPAASDSVVFSGFNTTNGVLWGASAGAVVASWTQQVEYAGTVILGTTFTNYSAAFTNFTVLGDMSLLGGSLTHVTNINTHNNAPTNRATHRLALTVGGNLLVGGGAVIHARNKGFKEGQPNANSGASHGGYGGGPSPAVYGSMFEPVLPGMGCVADYAANTPGNQPGGGAIFIRVSGASVVDGMIDGGCIFVGGNYTRAAAGGSVLLRTGTLSGSGFIRARGMNSSGGSNTGNGGGGRVAVILTLTGATFDGFAVTNIDAAAGTGGSSAYYGSAGSVYLLDGKGTATYVLDFINRYGDLVDDKVHVFTGESPTNCNLVLRNQALLGFAGAIETRRVRNMTADASSNVKFVNPTNRLTCDTLVFNAITYGRGLYTTNNLPDLLNGPGTLEILYGRARGTVMVIR